MFVLIDLRKFNIRKLPDDDLKREIESILSDTFNDMPRFNTLHDYWELEKIKEISLGRNNVCMTVHLSRNWNHFIWEQFQSAVAELTIEHCTHGLDPKSENIGPIFARLHTLQGVFTPESRAAIISKDDKYVQIETILSERKATMMEIDPDRFAWATIKLVKKHIR